MTRLTHKKIASLKLGKKCSEKVGNKGDGSLLFKCQTPGSVEAFYREKLIDPTTGRQIDNLISIGFYQTKPPKPGLTLVECRRETIAHAEFKRDNNITNLKAHLEQEKQQKEQAEKEERRAMEAEDAIGTLENLMQDYIDQLEMDGKGSVREVRRLFNKDMTAKFPLIVRKKAQDITPDDIVEMLMPIGKRGSIGAMEKGRTYLRAAFQQAITNEHDPLSRVLGRKKYCLSSNPADLVKSHKSKSQPVKRTLSNRETGLLWSYVEMAPKNGFIMSRFIRFHLAVAGNRPQKLAEATWDQYDFERKTLTVVSEKGRSRYVHIIPLSPMALSILDEIKIINGHHTYPFTTTGDKPIDINSQKNTIKRFREWYNEQAQQHGWEEIDHFTPRDIRRTAKRILIDAEVDRDKRNLLQGHAINEGVDRKHYDHHDHLPEKWKAIEAYETQLKKEIAENVLTLGDDMAAANQPGRFSVGRVTIADSHQATVNR